MAGLREDVLRKAVRYGWIKWISSGMILPDGTRIEGECIGASPSPMQLDRVFERVRKALKRQRSMPDEEKAHRMSIASTNSQQGLEIVSRLGRIADRLEWGVLDEDQFVLCSSCNFAFPKPTIIKTVLGDMVIEACNQCIVHVRELSIRYVDNRKGTNTVVVLPINMEALGWFKFLQEPVVMGQAVSPHIFGLHRALTERGYDCVLQAPPARRYQYEVDMSLWVRDVSAAQRVKAELEGE